MVVDVSVTSVFVMVVTIEEIVSVVVGLIADVDSADTVLSMPWVLDTVLTKVGADESELSVSSVALIVVVVAVVEPV